MPYHSDTPRTRSQKREYCMRCEQMSDFLFDHGLGYFICANCELE